VKAHLILAERMIKTLEGFNLLKLEERRTFNDVLADTVLDVPPQHYRLGRAPYLGNEGASDGDRHQRTHGGKESGSGRATEEGLFVEECRRLKINPNAFGERAVLKLMFGALIRAARALAMMSGLSLFSVMGRWSQSASLRRAMDC
jgi:hypothetical protein